jgi:NADPH2:quinone reductase
MAARARFQALDMHLQGRYLAEIAKRCDHGTFPKIHTRVFHGLTADHLREAHAAMERGQAHGKWVVKAI